MRIEIDPEFEKLIPPLTKEEFDQLEASITKDGEIRDPIVLWNPDPLGFDDLSFILDGHHRYRIGQKHNLYPGNGLPITQVDLRDREAALLWIEENQVARRNLSDDQRAVMWASILERREKISRANAAATAREAKADPSVADVSSATDRNPREEERATLSTSTRATSAVKTVPSDWFDGAAKGRKLREEEKAAKESRLPVRKLRAAKKLRKANPEAAEDVRQGKKTLRQAKREIQPPAKAAKPHDAECRWRKVDSLVSNLYGELPFEQRAREVRVLAERLRLKYPSLPNVSEEAA